MRILTSILVCSVALAAASAGSAQSVRTAAPAVVEKPVISLEEQASSAEIKANQPEDGRMLENYSPANVHFFRAARAGETSDAERLALHFAATTKLTGIAATADFKIEQGSSCVEGDVYAAGGSCQLLMRFTPQGGGRRSGKLTITHTASAKPLNVGLTGYGYEPSVSFTPAVISTVPGSYPSGKGLISGATSLAVDDGDTLYVADTGNNEVRYLNASGTFENMPSGFTFDAPTGVAVDDMGTVYSSQAGSDQFMTITPPESTDYGSYTGSCNVGQTCGLGTFIFGGPGAMAYDRNGAEFANVNGAILKFTPGTDSYLNATVLATDYNGGSTNEVYPLAVDTSDNLYTFYNYTYYSICMIAMQSEYSALNSLYQSRQIAGGVNGCGFAGDGGQARNALISGTVGQMAFDIAGNLYVSDTGNQRVRRIDGSTGVINTIAGNGTAGYSGDGGAGTAAELSAPNGVGVDSQGQVYILSSTTATGTAQVVRKLGPNGDLSFGSQTKGTASAAQTVTMANTGNSALTIQNVGFTGTAAGDFSIVPLSTSCSLAANAVLEYGQSCKIGISFKPSAYGTRSASLVITDNTIAGINVVNLVGTAPPPAPTFAITAPASGASFVSGTAVTFSVSVTAATTPAPTGTVKFTAGGLAYGSPVTISGGKASVSITGLGVGNHTLTATYSGDANYSAAGPLSRVVTVTAASKATSKVMLKAKANPASSCDPVSFSVSIANASTEGSSTEAPTGKVQLMEGKVVLASSMIVDGAATFTVSALPAGSHVLTAEYGGDSHHDAAASASLNETVTKGTACRAPSADPIHVTHPRE